MLKYIRKKCFISNIFPYVDRLCRNYYYILHSIFYKNQNLVCIISYVKFEVVLLMYFSHKF